MLGALHERLDRTVEELVSFARIPGVSADGFDRREVARSAQHAAQLVADAGFENADVVTLGDAHPYVAYLSRDPLPDVSQPDVRIDPDIARKLRALGYLAN